MALFSESHKKFLLPFASFAIVLSLLFTTVYQAQQRTSQRSKAAAPVTQTHNYDVVIAGAGTSGFAAAITAARMGVSVALLEESDWVGGQMTAASVAAIDDPGSEREYGVYKELIDKIRAYYKNPSNFPPEVAAALPPDGKPLATCVQDGTNSICFEPHVAQKMMREMITQTNGLTLASGKQAKLDLYTRTHVIEVLKSGTTITGAITQNGKQFNSKVLVDATEYGDLIPLTGARFRVGNTTSDAINPNACIQPLTYVATVRKFFTGVPDDLWLSTPPGGQEAYNQAKERFKTYLVKDRPIPSPSPEYPIGAGLAKPWYAEYHTAYRGMPDSLNPVTYTSATREEAKKISKSTLNFANDFDVTAKFLLDRTYRKQEICKAKLLTIQELYYVQHDMYNDPFNANYNPRTDPDAQWSVPPEENFCEGPACFNLQENNCPDIPDTIEKHLPQIPYVRESMRVIGKHYMTMDQVTHDYSQPYTEKVFGITHEDAVTLGDFTTDLHGCHLTPDVVPDDNLEEGKNPWDVVGGGPFQIPWNSYIPESIDGFLPAEKNFSQSRVVSGATRLHLVTMHTGQTIGVGAALSVLHNVQPRNLPYRLVQEALVSPFYPFKPSRLSPIEIWDVPRTLSNNTSNPLWTPVQLVSANKVIERTWLNGFAPQDPFNRSLAAVALSRLIFLPTESFSTKQTFTDVPTTHPMHHAIEAIFDKKITTGCTPTTFCPSNAVDRAQLAVFLTRALNIDTPGFSPSPSQTTFSDVPQNFWAQGFIEYIANTGIMEPCITSPKQFCPNQQLNRGEAAVIFSKAMIFLANRSIAPAVPPTSTIVVPTHTLTPLPTNTPTPTIAVPTITPTRTPTKSPTPTPICTGGAYCTSASYCRNSGGKITGKVCGNNLYCCGK